MYPISPLVEKANAELIKRINRLGLMTSKHYGGGKASVMGRVTNAFCGSGGVAYTNLQSVNNANATPEKPSRSVPAVPVNNSQSVSASNNKNLNNSRRTRIKILRNKLKNAPIGGGDNQCYVAPTTWEQLMQDDRFLKKFFLHFSPTDRRVLAQVCTKWRDVLYAYPPFWTGLVPVLKCREARIMSPGARTRLYASLLTRKFRTLVLLGASDEDIPELTHDFPMSHVYSLSLRCCAITDRGLETLLDHLEGLYALELAGCNEITEAGLWTCLTPRIVSLSLSDCINVADEAVGAVGQLLPSLYEFSLQAYHVTDAALSFFSAKQSDGLRVLRLQSCWELTNHGIVNMVHSLPHLTVLSLSGCSKVTDDGVELIAENLPRLRSLDLSWCSRITDAALGYIAGDLYILEELKLDRCAFITDTGIGYISTMESLKDLFLRWCTQLGDLGLQHLCGMQSLRILSVAGCRFLTCSGFCSLIQLRHIHELELTNCPGTSRELFDYLREHLPRCLIIE